MKVLAVEDDESNRELLAEIMNKFGYDYDLAETGRSGVEMLNGKDYDVVLTDFALPDISGCEVAQAAKEKISGGGVRRHHGEWQ